MRKERIKLAIVGVGKIVHDQHVPSIEKSNEFELVATASRNGSVDGVTAYKDIQSMLSARPDIQAVALCMPPQYRYKAAVTALNHGMDVLLEKPPGATISEVEALSRLASKNHCCLYTTWHSRHAAGVEPAKKWLVDQAENIVSVRIVWKENVRKWHPNQDWIWQAGGLGVFDPGINGLSILSEILPMPFFVQQSTLSFPENRQAPIAAKLVFETGNGIEIDGDFDWRVEGDEQWSIEIETGAGNLSLTHGGAQLQIEGAEVELPQHSEHGEYLAIYANFAKAISNRSDLVDLTPLKLVADAFLLGNRSQVAAFND